MVSFQALNLFYGLCKPHGQVEKHVALVSSSGGASEVADMPCGSASPVDYNVSREEKTTEPVKPPEIRVISNYKYQNSAYIAAGIKTYLEEIL